jgi:hypothetical protein
VQCSWCRFSKQGCDLKKPCGECKRHGLVCEYANDTHADKGASSSQQPPPGSGHPPPGQGPPPPGDDNQGFGGQGGSRAGQQGQNQTAQEGFQTPIGWVPLSYKTTPHKSIRTTKPTAVLPSIGRLVTDCTELDKLEKARLKKEGKKGKEFKTGKRELPSEKPRNMPSTKERNILGETRAEEKAAVLGVAPTKMQLGKQTKIAPSTKVSKHAVAPADLSKGNHTDWERSAKEKQAKEDKERKAEEIRMKKEKEEKEKRERKARKDIEKKEKEKHEKERKAREKVEQATRAKAKAEKAKAKAKAKNKPKTHLKKSSSGAAGGLKTQPLIVVR